MASHPILIADLRSLAALHDEPGLDEAADTIQLLHSMCEWADLLFEAFKVEPTAMDPDSWRIAWRVLDGRDEATR